MTNKNWDNRLIEENRKHLDLLFSNRKSNDNIPLLTKCLRILKGFGVKGLFHLMKKKVLSKRRYISNLEEEQCPPIDWKNKKIAVYTAIIGNYDALKEPKFISPFCDYFIFTDMDIPKDSIWKRCELPKNKDYLELNNYQKAKYFKIFPNILFPDYDYSIWVDGNITIIGDLTPFVARMNDKIFAGFLHPNNDCIYEEAYTIVSQGKAKARDVKNQIKQYRKEGFPEHYGLLENSLLIRKHNDPRCIKLMEMWWNQMKIYTWRDQLSLSYVLWKSGIGFDDVRILGPCWRWNPRLRQDNHK